LPICIFNKGMGTMNEHILLIGAGSVGLGLSSALLTAGGALTILSRPDGASEIKTKGITRTGIFGTVQTPQSSVTIITNLSELKTLPTMVIVCVKSFNSKEIAILLKRYFEGATAGHMVPVILFQNGYGNYEIFCKFFPKERIFNARVITGFIRKSFTEVEITAHADAIHIGHMDGYITDHINNLCDLLSQGGIPTEPSETIEKDIWSKILFNALLNPLGAIRNVPYGDLASHLDTKLIMNAIAGEIFEVIEKYGYRSHYKNREAFLEHFYRFLIPLTQKHESSMLFDIRKGRKTEIDSLNGAIVNLAKGKDISVPVNEKIVYRIKRLEQST